MQPFPRPVKLLTTVFLGIFAVALFSLPVQAACDFGKFEVGIPGINAGQDICTFVAKGNTPLLSYLGIIINAATGFIIVIGLMSIVVAGYFYITAGGDSGRISTAKTWFVSALLGIFLALVAYTVLYTISPQFAPTQDPVLNLP